MNPKIHLLYFPACPNWKKAQESLQVAIKTNDKNIIWKEINLESADCPKSWRGFPSPTILINGTDIQSGESHMEGTTSCRSNGSPSVDAIRSYLKIAEGDEE